MKKIVFVFFISLSIFFAGCKESSCDECLNQKKYYCNALFEYNCNSALLTTNIDNLIKSCGQDEANSYISTTAHLCTVDSLTCPEGCD